MSNYITDEQLKATLEISGEVFADSDVSAAITAASRGIDKACGRFFYPADAPSDRYYRPSSAYLVLIDDLYDFDALLTDQDGDGTFEQAWTENADFVCEPLNALADGEPFTRLCLNPNANVGFPYYYPRSVKLTGKYGWAAVPGPISEATTILASKLLKRAREAPFGIVSIGIDVGATARIARSDPDVAFLIQPYIREKP